MELGYHEDAIFITLTYNDDNLPFSPDGYQTLVKSDLQQFFKRLRYHLDDRKISHYSCGEYGDKYGRPHYHSIVYGMSHKDRELIEKSWDKGLIHIGSVSPASIAYVAGYIQKKLYGKPARDKDIVQPFSLMSSKPAIGYRFIEEYHDKLFADGYIQFPRYRVGLPRYFRKKLEDDFGYVFDFSYYQGLNEDADLREREYWRERLAGRNFVEFDDGNVFISDDFDLLYSHIEYYKNLTKERNRIAKSKLINKGVL